MGQGLAAETFSGKCMSAGLRIPIMCLRGGSEGSPQSSSDTLASYCLVCMSFMYLLVIHLSTRISSHIFTDNRTCELCYYPFFISHNHCMFEDGKEEVI